MNSLPASLISGNENNEKDIMSIPFEGLEEKKNNSNFSIDENLKDYMEELFETCETQQECMSAFFNTIFDLSEDIECTEFNLEHCTEVFYKIMEVEVEEDPVQFDDLEEDELEGDIKFETMLEEKDPDSQPIGPGAEEAEYEEKASIKMTVKAPWVKWLGVVKEDNGVPTKPPEAILKAQCFPGLQLLEESIEERYSMYDVFHIEGRSSDGIHLLLTYSMQMDKLKMKEFFEYLAGLYSTGGVKGKVLAIEIAYETKDRYGRDYLHTHVYVHFSYINTTSKERFAIGGHVPHVARIKNTDEDRVRVLRYIRKEDVFTQMVDGVFPSEVEVVSEIPLEFKALWDLALDAKYIGNGKLNFIIAPTLSYHWGHLTNLFTKVINEKKGNNVRVMHGYMTLKEVKKEIKDDKKGGTGVSFYGSEGQKYVFWILDRKLEGKAKTTIDKINDTWNSINYLMMGDEDKKLGFKPIRVIVLAKWTPTIIGGRVIEEHSQLYFAESDWEVGNMTNIGISWKKDQGPTPHILDYVKSVVGNKFPLPKQ